MEIPQASSTGELERSENTNDNENRGDYGNEDEVKPTRKRETYYGLHWRKELNWRAMCFEFVDLRLLTLPVLVDWASLLPEKLPEQILRKQFCHPSDLVSFAHKIRPQNYRSNQYDTISRDKRVIGLTFPRT